MKRLIFTIVVAAFTAINVSAQVSDSLMETQKEITVDSLQVRLNSLQYSYDYLKCEYEINKINCNLAEFSNSISISANSLLTSYYNTKFNIDLYTASVSKYQSDMSRFNSLKLAADGIKDYVESKISISGFTEKDIELLIAYCNVLDTYLSNVESSLNYYKATIDAYKSLR